MPEEPRTTDASGEILGPRSSSVCRRSLMTSNQPAHNFRSVRRKDRNRGKSYRRRAADVCLRHAPFLPRPGALSSGCPSVVWLSPMSSDCPMTDCHLAVPMSSDCLSLCHLAVPYVIGLSYDRLSSDCPSVIWLSRCHLTVPLSSNCPLCHRTVLWQTVIWLSLCHLAVPLSSGCPYVIWLFVPLSSSCPLCHLTVPLSSDCPFVIWLSLCHLTVPPTAIATGLLDCWSQGRRQV